MLDLNPDRWLARLEDRWAAEEFAEPEPVEGPVNVKSLAAVCACGWRGETEAVRCPDCGGILEDEGGDDE